MLNKTIIFSILILLLVNCLEADSSKTFIYNDRDQLVSIESSDDPGKLTTFDYDGAGNRISKTQNGVTTEYKGKLINNATRLN